MANAKESTRALKVVQTEAEKAAPEPVVTESDEKVEGADEATGPNLPELQSALTEFASMQRPALLRADLVRQQAAQNVREIERELDDLNANEALIDRAYEAAKQALNAQRTDLEGALALLQHGLVGADAGARD